MGTLTGLAALAGSSCCALPVALAGLGATGAVFGGLRLLASARPILLGVATSALLVGWGLFLRPRATCAEDGGCASVSWPWRTGIPLGIGTTLCALALVWEPYLEPMILKLMR